MRIIIVRHGETDNNKENKIQGLKNNLLNNRGRRQACKLREKILSQKIDACYMSPLVRCVETAMILVGDRVVINPDKRLVERDMGEYENKDRNLYDSQLYWDYRKNISTGRVESVQSIFERCRDFLEYLNSKYSDDSTILIVSHGAPVRAIHYILKDIDLNNTKLDLDVKNCYYEELTMKKH